MSYLELNRLEVVLAVKNYLVVILAAENSGDEFSGEELYGNESYGEELSSIEYSL